MVSLLNEDFVNTADRCQAKWIEAHFIFIYWHDSHSRNRHSLLFFVVVHTCYDCSYKLHLQGNYSSQSLHDCYMRYIVSGYEQNHHWNQMCHSLRMTSCFVLYIVNSINFKFVAQANDINKRMDYMFELNDPWTSTDQPLNQQHAYMCVQRKLLLSRCVQQQNIGAIARTGQQGPCTVCPAQICFPSSWKSM